MNNRKVRIIDKRTHRGIDFGSSFSAECPKAFVSFSFDLGHGRLMHNRRLKMDENDEAQTWLNSELLLRYRMITFIILRGRFADYIVHTYTNSSFQLHTTQSAQSKANQPRQKDGCP